MMQQIETSLSERYNRPFVPDIREFVQNALDYVSEKFPKPFVPTVRSSNQGVMACLHDRSGTLVLQIETRNDGITIKQKMSPKTKLPRSSLYLYSEKQGRSIGGFGEGMKITALHLLREGCTLSFLMHEERWDWLLVPKKNLPCRIMVVNISQNQSSWPNDLMEIRISSKPPKNCLVLFKPENFLSFSPPKHVLFGSATCQFISFAEKDSSAKIFVNGVFLKQSRSVSFSVNLKLDLHQLSADRDCLRVEESVQIAMELSMILGTNEEAQKVCFYLLERCKGIPRQDLKLLPQKRRLHILKELKRKSGHDRAWPIKPDAKEGTKQVTHLSSVLPTFIG